MGTQSAISHNPGVRASGKRDFPLARRVASALGLTASWPNLQSIRLAVENEAAYSRASLAEVAEMLVRAGSEWTAGDPYSPPSNWEQRDIFRLNQVDRFWFEDQRWRAKFAYAEFREHLRKSVEPTA